MSRYFNVDINSSTDGSAAAALPVAPAPTVTATLASEAPTAWTRFWGIAEAILFYGLLLLGLSLPFVGLIVKFVRG